MDEEILAHLEELCGSRQEAEDCYDDFVAQLERDNDEWVRTKYQRERQAAYLERGVTVEALVIAQQESLEGDDTALNELKAIRAQVKTDIPKPTANT